MFRAIRRIEIANGRLFAVQGILRMVSMIYLIRVRAWIRELTFSDFSFASIELLGVMEYGHGLTT